MVRSNRAGKPSARQLAYSILNRVERDRAWAEAVLNHEMERCELPALERGFAARLVYGCLAWKKYLDWHIAAFCLKAPSRLKPEVRQLLRIGLYQILLLDRVPAYAAVSSTVDLARMAAPWATSLVNAVLRRAVREKAQVTFPDPVTNRLEHLAVRYSHPEWMVRMWLEDPELEAFLAANNQSAPTVLRASKAGGYELIGLLANAGIAARPGQYAPEAVVLEGKTDLATLKKLCGHQIVMQGEASQLIAHMLAPSPAGTILDACAGPGGKATYMAELGGRKAHVLALDIRPQAASKVAGLAQRLGISNLSIVAGDARKARNLFGHALFDRVLVDAPCSGLGTLRSHPELRWIRQEQSIGELAQVQLDIMRGVAPLVGDAGLLVYSTCTLTRAENEEVIRSFKEEQREFQVKDPRAFLPVPAHTLVGSQDELRTLPHKHGLDGFFAVCLQRTPTR